MKAVYKQRLEGDNALNYAVKWEKSSPGRGKDRCKDLDVRAYLPEEQQEACIARRECIGESVIGRKLRRVTRVQYHEGSARPLCRKSVEGSNKKSDLI